MNSAEERALTEACENLSRMHRMFCEHFLNHFNAARALRETDSFGGNPKNASAQAWQLLQRDDVKAYLKLRMDYLAGELGISAQRVLRRVEVLAFSNIIEALESAEDGTIRVKRLSDIPPDVAQSIRKIRQIPIQDKVTGEVIEYRVEVELHDTMAALKLLFSYLGLDNTEDKAEKTLKRLKGIDAL